MIHLRTMKVRLLSTHYSGSVAAIMIAVALSACSPEPVEEQASNEGEQIFERSCAACHGQAGRGPSMDDIRALSSDELRAAIANHPRAGDVLDRLNAADIGSLVEYLEN